MSRGDRVRMPLDVGLAPSPKARSARKARRHRESVARREARRARRSEARQRLIGQETVSEYNEMRVIPPTGRRRRRER